MLLQQSRFSKYGGDDIYIWPQPKVGEEQGPLKLNSFIPFWHFIGHHLRKGKLGNWGGLENLTNLGRNYIYKGMPKLRPRVYQLLLVPPKKPFREGKPFLGEKTFL